MKRFLAVGLLVVLAAVTAMTWSADRAEAARWVTKPVLWAGGADTTFIEGLADTIRSQPIDISDWDFLSQTGTTAAHIGSVALVVTGASDGQTDTLYYAVEKSWDGANWTQAGFSTGAGNQALPQGGGLSAVVPAVYAGVLTFDWDTAANLTPVPKMIRLKVGGDQSGTTPANSRVRLYITYPTLFDY